MKFINAKTFIIIFLLIIFSSCSNTRADYNYILDRGGIDFEDPFLKDETYYISINCDATGVTEITIKPKVITSYPIYYTDYKLDIIDNNINIYLKYSLVERGQNIKEIKLGNIKKGQYNIYYLNEDNTKILLKTINLL